MNDEWSLVFEGIDPATEGVRETLCTLGNGYFATRGAWPEQRAGRIHYPGTYVAGLYDRATTAISGRVVENEDLVNLPDWLALDMCLDGTTWLSLHDVEVLLFRQELDLRRGLLTRHVEVRDGVGRETGITQRRFVHMADMHLAGLQTTYVAHNWSGRILVRSSLDGQVRNAGVARYRALAGRHLRIRQTSEEGAVIALLAQTAQSGVRVAEAARTTAHHNGDVLDVPRCSIRGNRRIAQELSIELSQQVAVTVEKIVALHTSRDRGGCEPLADARERLQRAGRFDELLEQHVLAWRHLWERFDVTVEGDARVQLAVRVNLFHLLQTTSPNTVDLDVGVPARGLHGEAYRGHVFWDELFVLPVLSLHMPVLARASLMYRHRRLDSARWAAAAEGLTGAMFPWQSGSNGREESQRLHLNPRSGHWQPDNSHLQRHVGLAVAWNIWHYYQVTGDVQFLRYYGAPTLLEIARYFAVLADYDRGTDRFRIRGVMGPDEYHDGYPGRSQPGIDDNAYTNVMTAWLMLRALDVLDLLPIEDHRELRQELRLTDEELDRWDVISRKMTVPFHDDGAGPVISQFAGYEALAELDWAEYRATYADIRRLDRILEAAGDTPNRYRLSKQADVLMLFFLLSTAELATLLARLGYPSDEGLFRRTIDYYLARTAHGSTLSSAVHGSVLARSKPSKSWEFFVDTINADIADTQRGTTREGIHLGAMAATVDLLQRCYCGIEARNEVLCLAPMLPDQVQALDFPLHYRGQRVRIRVTHRTMTVTSVQALAGPISIGFRDEVHELKPGASLEFRL